MAIGPDPRSAEVSFECPLPGGLHARPASRIAEVAAQFASETSLLNRRNRRQADLKSALSIIAADVQHGDPCSLLAAGADGDAALSRLRQLVMEELPAAEQTFSPGEEPNASSAFFRALPAGVLRGVSISSGAATGKLVHLAERELPKLPPRKAEPVAAELQAAENAFQAVANSLRGKVAAARERSEQDLLKAHLSLATDSALQTKVREAVSQGSNAGEAVVQGVRHFLCVLESSTSALFRARAADLHEIALQLLQHIYGGELPGQPLLRLRDESIVVAESLGPQQLLAFERRFLKGVVLGVAGAASHAVILAKSLGIPTIAAVELASLAAAKSSGPVYLDATRGLLYTQWTPEVDRVAAREQALLARHQEKLLQSTSKPAMTRDGVRVEVAANVSSREEVLLAAAQGAEGIGLFRTEGLFLGRETLPSEEEQFAAYRAAAESKLPGGVLLRTLDIGADKPLPAVAMPREENPFLGARGARLYRSHPALLRTQLRAMLRASAFGPLKIMFPMIATVEEFRECLQALTQAKEELRSEGANFDANIPVGTMIEVPAASQSVAELAAHAEFFSVGSNDLAQYFFAVDRGNPAVAHLAQPRHPAFLRMLAKLVADARAAGKWSGLCGDIAADSRNLPLLVGMGLSEISMPAGEVAAAKAALAQLDSAECRALLHSAMACSDREEVEKLLDSFSPASPASLINEELVVLDADCLNKDEALQQLCDMLFLAGRLRSRVAFERALWQREAIYSTGLGFGFATPHCKTDALLNESIVVARFAGPVEWNSVDGKPVHVAILLAVREASGAKHLRVFARLARKMMDEDFRRQILTAPSPAAVVSFLEQQLELKR